jgi:hypothetical protein
LTTCQQQFIIISNETGISNKMTDKLIVSNYTYLTIEQQTSRCADFPVFTLPQDLSFLMRPTRRKETDVFHCANLAILAESEFHVRKFVREAWKLGAVIRTFDGQTYSSACDIRSVAEKWKEARKSGAGRIGAQISADRKRAKSAEGIKLIREDWPKPSAEFSTEELKKRSGLSLNTIKAYLGSRPIAQYNYQAAQKRKERRNAKI